MHVKKYKSMKIEADAFQISPDSPYSTAVAPSITLEESKDWSFNLPICSPPLWYHREIQMKLLKYFGKPENRNVFPCQVFNDIAIRCFVDINVKEPKICTQKIHFGLLKGVPLWQWIWLSPEAVNIRALELGWI